MIAAIVVLYHPSLALLERLMLTINGQVDLVIAVDNTPGYFSAGKDFFDKFQIKVAYIPLGNNCGIARAQNKGILQAAGMGCSHVLLLDQDSALTEGAVAKLVLAEHELLKAGKKVAAVGPVFVDEKTGNQSCAIHHSLFRVQKIPLDISSAEPVETDNLIASGSIIRTTTLDLVGIMRGDLFIDFVDTEWGLRARSRGYKSYCIPHCVMRHSIGEAAVRVFGKDVFVHGDVRNYYRLRNAIFLLRIKTMGWGWRTYMAVRIPYYFLLFPWLSKNKMKNIRLVLKALMDGLTARLGHIAMKAE